MKRYRCTHCEFQTDEPRVREHGVRSLCRGRLINQHVEMPAHWGIDWAVGKDRTVPVYQVSTQEIYGRSPIVDILRDMRIYNAMRNGLMWTLPELPFPERYGPKLPCGKCFYLDECFHPQLKSRRPEDKPENWPDCFKWPPVFNPSALDKLDSFDDGGELR